MEPDTNTTQATASDAALDAQENAPHTLAMPESGPIAEVAGGVAKEATTDPAPTESTTATNGLTDQPASDPVESTSAPAPEPTAPVAEDAPQQDTDMKDGAEAAPEAPDAVTEDATAEANGTSASKKSSNGRRKSGGIPEHKSKKLGKKKSMPKLTHLDAQPGELYFARLKSYPPWPSIVCDEDMLPESLINTRPVTTKKADGNYNEPYADGGKKVTDRTFPIMFLYTNEFAWIPNTDLNPLNPEDCKEVSEKGKAKALLAAYEVATEGHDLAYFKDMLHAHASAMAEEEQRIQEIAAEKAAKAERKKRKSEAKVETDDVDMEDADTAAEVKKSAKKRKKVAESDDEEPEKPAKTPKKTTLKLTTNKTPATTEKKPKEKSSKPKSERKKPKAAASDEEMADAPEEEPEKPQDPEEARKAREREVLFLRHKLQKGFLSRDQAPQEEDMPQMSNYIKKLENYEDLEVSIIRATKINKVLKALVKLNTIPRDEEFNFRKRSVDMLGRWNKILGADSGEGEPSTTEKESKSTPTTNGVHEESGEDKKEAVAPPAENAAQQAEAVEKVAEGDADQETKTAMSGAVQEESKQPTVEDATPAAEAKVNAAVEMAAEPAVIEKAPESAEAAAEAIDTVKAAE